MPLMNWNNQMSVGLQMFDTEHHKLVGMLNELYDAIMIGKGKEVLKPILDGLIEYTSTHFAHEEEQMNKYGFPELTTHRKEHQDLTKQVLQVQAKFNGGATSALSMEVLAFLKNWLVNHIQGTDKKYGPFLKSKGIK